MTVTTYTCSYICIDEDYTCLQFFDAWLGDRKASSP